MPEEDVSDLRDVVDAINRLCDTMKTSTYNSCDDLELEMEENLDEQKVDLDENKALVIDKVYCEPVKTQNVDYGTQNMETYVAETWTERDINEYIPEWKDTMENAAQLYTAEELREVCSPLQIDVDDVKSESMSDVERTERTNESLLVQKVETVNSWTEPTKQNDAKVDSYTAGKWRECTTQIEDLDAASDTDHTAVPEPASEMYYTASSEVSLLSDEAEKPDESKDSKDDRNSVMSGHVAAMRERFESMTRTNTPCPDLMRSSSPSLDVFRNITPSPDFLG